MAGALAILGVAAGSLGVWMVIAAQQGGMFALFSLQVGFICLIVAALAIVSAMLVWRRSGARR